MTLRSCSILSLVPYKILPPKTGGQLSIMQFHHYLGKLCPDHVVSTANNTDASAYQFEMHKTFPNGPMRYVPFARYLQVLSIAKKYDCTHIICDHPYMAPLAMMLARKLGVPWYLRSHNIESMRFKDLGKKWWKLMFEFERYAMRKANATLFVTTEDIDWAVQHYGVPASKCHHIPFGTHFSERPQPQPGIKQKLAERMYVEADKPWLYFLGALDYAPNIQAVTFILDEIIPRLDNSGQPYQILVGGKGLPEELQMRIAGTENIQYTGFIDDLDQFLLACDVMLNPMLQGGGVKTKAIEALAYSKQVVSTFNGAAGISREVCGDNLNVSADNDWDSFAQDVLRVMHQRTDIPDSFYKLYHWGHVAEKVVSLLTKA